jgi:HEAT repeat protein
MKNSIRSSASWLACLAVLAVSPLAVSLRVVAAEENQAELIRLLQSDAAPGDKAIACKKLAIYGTKDAVPALAPLLTNPDLSSWARIALEAIPDPAADAALRDAVGKVQGRLLVGVINSIGVRRDAEAVKPLAGKLSDGDAAVASAAAIALGRIGTKPAAEVLQAALAGAPVAVRPSVARGCLLCAERFLAEGKASDATELCDLVRKADLPKQVLVEATRGAILSRQTAGLPLLLEQLRSADPELLGIGLRVARELSGAEVTTALAAEMGRASADRQALILLAIADRSDTAVLPVVMRSAQVGPVKQRVAAVGVLERLGNVSCVPTLLTAATASEAELAKRAVAALARLPGADVDAELLKRLPDATGKTRQVLIELVGQRRLSAALPAVLASAADADAGVRGAAVQSIGALGESAQTGDLVRLLQKTSSAPERAAIEKALLTLGGRAGAACAPHLLPLMGSDDPALRVIALHAFGAIGGPEALTAVKSALDDKVESVQDEAVRTLSTWPANWPDDHAVAEPLLALARSGKKLAHQVLGLRGYLQCVQEDKQLNAGQKVAKVGEIRSLLKRPEETRLAISTLGSLPAWSAVELLLSLAGEPAVTEDACSAIVNLAGRNLEGGSKDQIQKALQTVLEKSKEEATRKKAQRILDGLKSANK